MLFNGEQEAIDKVVEAGATYGYGNMIAHLKREWAERLMSQEKAALAAADISAYPIRKDK